MKIFDQFKPLWLIGLLTCSLILTGCMHETEEDTMEDDDMMQMDDSKDDDKMTDDDTMMDNKTMAKYEISVINITHGQPLTPAAAILHGKDYHPWMLGSEASTGLEKLAESGDTSDFVSQSMSNTAVLDSQTSTGGPFGPGANKMLMVTAEHSSNLQLSVASMLANTNDAFSGVSNWHIGGLEVGKSMSTLARVYDAGTEANTEAAGTLPGPADSGEGFNAARESRNTVVIHPGVVTADDGLSTSVLTEAHRWLGPAAKIIVTRKE